MRHGRRRCRDDRRDESRSRCVEAEATDKVHRTWSPAAPGADGVAVAGASRPPNAFIAACARRRRPLAEKAASGTAITRCSLLHADDVSRGGGTRGRQPVAGLIHRRRSRAQRPHRRPGTEPGARPTLGELRRHERRSARVRSTDQAQACAILTDHFRSTARDHRHRALEARR